MEELVDLRQELHTIPELAFHETKTKARLMDWLKEHTTLQIVDCGNWFYLWYQGEDSDCIAFRADFDAVPGKDGCPGHYCGHDGHATILAGLAVEVAHKLPKKSVLLIFQPAEEIGQGAILCRDILKEKHVSEIYGFHNIPGYPEKSIILLDGTFACASTGLEITINGTPSHAAYPEAGKNPAAIIAKMILKKDEYLKPMNGLAQMTIIGVDLGSDSYGVSASQGVLRMTVRAEYENEFQKLVENITQDAEALTDDAGMTCSVKKIEEFPTTENDSKCVERIKHAAVHSSISDSRLITPSEPFRWSEDFGYYLQVVPGAMIGVGDGDSWPQLHTEDYEFPDEIMKTVIDLFLNLVE